MSASVVSKGTWRYSFLQYHASDARGYRIAVIYMLEAYQLASSSFRSLGMSRSLEDRYMCAWFGLYCSGSQSGEVRWQWWRRQRWQPGLQAIGLTFGSVGVCKVHCIARFDP